MNNEIILLVKNISKQYRLGLVGTGTIGHDLNRWWYKIRGKEDPYLKIGEINNRETVGSSKYVWALKHINFEVRQGEVLGIIGKNGAGKSTLLKILSKVTGPTIGEIKTKGRIASLLEVGTGFHGEMTGRENIYLNGAILGMTKVEIKSKIEDIINFSGCQRYIDTPVKRYSSGMTVRLAFAVAAFLEPEILVVDEVLAVGDAEFQKKAIGKMQDISQTNGRTVLFVSHNMAAVKNLCDRVIVLKSGSVVFEGGTNEAVDFYLKANEESNQAIYITKWQKNDSDILGVSVLGADGNLCSTFGFDNQIYFNIKIKILKKHLAIAVLGFRVIDQLERAIFTSEIELSDYVKKEGEYSFKVKLPFKTLVPNDYKVNIAMHVPNKEIIRNLEGIVGFTIEETGSEFFKYSGKDYGCVILENKWDLEDA